MTTPFSQAVAVALNPQQTRADAEPQSARLTHVLEVFSSSATHGGYLLEFLFAWLASAKQKCETDPISLQSLKAACLDMLAASHVCF